MGASTGTNALTYPDHGDTGWYSVFQTFAQDITDALDSLDFTHLSADATPDGAADYVMTYDASAGANKKVLIDNLPITATVSALSDVGDVTITTIASGEILKWNGSAWINNTLDEAGIVADSDFGSNGLCTRTAANTYANRTITGTSNEIDVTNGDGVSGNPTLALPSTVDLTSKTLKVPNGGSFAAANAGELGIDTTIANYTGLIKYHDGVEELSVVAMPTANLGTNDGYVVSYNATNDEFELVAQSGGGASALNDLSDVTVSASATGDLLMYTGSAYVNQTINDLTADASPNGAADYVMTWDADASALKKVLLNNLPGGSAAMPDQVINFEAAALKLVETNTPAPGKLSGTNVKHYVLAFDDTTEEFGNGSFIVSQDLDTAGTVTFRAYVMAATAAASKNVALTFGHYALNSGEDFDAATPYTDEDSGDTAIDATQDNVTEIVWTETVSNLGWAAGDMVLFRLSRYAASANNLTGDMYLFHLAIEIPQA